MYKASKKQKDIIEKLELEGRLTPSGGKAHSSFPSSSHMASIIGISPESPLQRGGGIVFLFYELRFCVLFYVCHSATLQGRLSVYLCFSCDVLWFHILFPYVCRLVWACVPRFPGGRKG